MAEYMEYMDRGEVVGQVPAESEKKRGFPSLEQEKEMRQTFFHKFKDQLIAKIISVGVPKPTEYQTEKMLHYLYGIYFYDYVTGGRVITGKTGVESLKKKAAQIIMGIPPESRRDINKLSDWPLVITNFPSTAEAYPEVGFVSLNISQFTDNDGKKKDTFFKGFEGTTATMPYETSKNNDWVLNGIEEASHLDFSHLDRTHYNRGKPTRQPKGPLKDLGLRDDLLERRSVEYNILLGEEYAAEIVQGTYVRLYFPELWEKSYKRIYEEIIARRKKAVRSNR